LRAVVHLTPDNVEIANVTGYLILTQDEESCPVKMTGKIYGLSEGLHGFHVHEKGDIRQGCLSAGPHFNPTKVTHGGQRSPVRHVGDLGNILANAHGEASVDITDSLISLAGPHNILGRAIVVHAGEDDLGLGMSPDSLTTGNSGGRVACGTISAS
ncbi:Superoxide dismutase [Cu-Zn], partial [Dufourea novaeangliae]